MSTVYNSYTDDMLLSLLNQGDREAFTEIYNRYWDKLFFVAGKKVIDMGEAESLVHDVLCDLWVRRETLQVKTNLNNYLAASLKYCVIKLMQKQNRKADSLSSTEHDEIADKETPETIVEFDQLRTKLQLLVRDLPAQCRFAYQLKQDGFTQKEIAAKLQIAEHTVERHLSRAYKSLRTALLQYLKIFF